jgi:F-type H+-transporting ATPase subunit alpha
MGVADQVVSIYAGTNGYLDDIEVRDVRRFEDELLDYMHTRKGEFMSTIGNSGAVPSDDELEQAVKDFKASFQPSEAGAGATSTSAEPVGPETTPETLETE